MGRDTERSHLVSTALVVSCSRAAAIQPSSSGRPFVAGHISEAPAAAMVSRALIRKRTQANDCKARL